MPRVLARGVGVFIWVKYPCTYSVPSTHHTYPARVLSEPSVLKVHSTGSKLQGYLAHRKLPPPQDHRRALGMTLL